MISEDYKTTVELWRQGHIRDRDIALEMLSDGLFCAWILEHLREPAE